MRKCLQVVLVANSLPALNDVTAMELPDIVAEAAKVCFLSSITLISNSRWLSCLTLHKMAEMYFLLRLVDSRNSSYDNLLVFFWSIHVPACYVGFSSLLNLSLK